MGGEGNPRSGRRHCRQRRRNQREEVAEIFGLPVDVVQRILAFDEETRMQRAMQGGVEAVREMVATWRAALMPRLGELPPDGSAERERAEIIRQLDGITPRHR